MPIQKIYKNVSGGDLTIFNKLVANGASYEVPPRYWLDAYDNQKLLTLIASGDIVLNDGAADLSPSEALSHLLRWQTAEETRFDNSTNGYSAKNAQAAIEESFNAAILKPRFSIITSFNGTIGNNDWLGYDNLLPGDQVPIRIPLVSRLKEVTVAYKNTALLGIPVGSNLIDGRLQIFKSGLNDPANVVHTETFTNQANGKEITGLNVLFSPGDYLVSRWKDDGNNPSDMAIVYFFQVE